MRFSRRAALGLSAAALTGAVAGCGGPSSRTGAADQAKLRAGWYGGDPVHAAMKKALNGYTAAHPGVSIEPEFAPFDSYWDKLATETAGRSAPDVFRMSMSYFADYAQRGALLDLSEVIGSAIDTSKLDADVAASGKIADGVYGVGQSSISHAVFTNPKAWADAGLHAPEEDWTWESFADLASRYAKKAGSGRYGTTDAGGMLQIFEVFVRQNGRQLFTADGTGLAATASDVEAWLAYWQRLRQDKAAPPLNVSTETGDFNTNLLSQGKAPLTFGWVQQVTFYQPLVDDPLDIMPVPGRTAGSLSGQFLKALDFWVISSASKNTTAAAALIDYLINDQRAVTDLGLTLGVPPSKNARTELGAKPHSAEAKAIAYIDKITDSVGKPPGAWPKGYSEISDALNRVNQDVGFGRTDPAKGAARFVDEGSQALG